jgi:adenosylmethionine-8-amino-7-oxononanoate aminotransferase
MMFKISPSYRWIAVLNRQCKRYSSSTSGCAAPFSTASSAANSTSSPILTCACENPESCENQCSSLLKIDRQHVLHPYTSMTNPLPTFPISSARGVHLTLNDGRLLIDGMSSWWAAVHGYRHPVLDAALKEQLEDSMSHVMFGGLTHKPAVHLARKLLQLVSNNNNDVDHHHFTKVFFSDSGSVSVEVAMKMALQYWFTLEQPSKTKFLSLHNGYHGDTLGAMSVCDPVNGMHSMFSGILAKQFFVSSPTVGLEEDGVQTITEMEQTLMNHHEEIAAVVMEPIVQGAGGMRFYHPSVLRNVRRLCDEYNVLLILDEIATGFGRTGTMFASWQNESTYRPWYSTQPHHHRHGKRNDDSNDVGRDEEVVNADILCLGKALTGGYMTLGATLTTDKVAHGISHNGGVFMHGPTFMANPLACSVSLASMNLLSSSPWEERVRNVEKALIKHLSPLSELDSVREVRVLGAIGVCELKEGLDRDGMARMQRALVEEGVWLRPFGKLLYTMPPFNCEELEEDHVKKIGEAMYKVVASQ